jgi:hypothetical protein
MENNGIKRLVGLLIVSAIGAHQFKKGLYQAEIRQDVTTEYPSMRVGNSNSDLLFGLDKFTLPEGQKFVSTRVAFVPLPSEMSIETVQEAVNANPGACIYAIRSNKVEDVLTVEQKQSIILGQKTLDDYRKSRVVKDKEGKDLPGTPQYVQNFFSLTAKEDIDLRTVKTNVDAENANVLSLVAKGQPEEKVVV